MRRLPVVDVSNSLADRVRLALVGHQVVEGPFMHGKAFWVDKKLVVSILEDELLVRVPPDDYERLVLKSGCRPFEFAARPVPSWVLVEAIALSGDDTLSEWVSIGLEGLPAP